MSAPEANAFPPAPVITMTRTDLSARKSSIASMAAVHISREIALWRSGLLRISQPTPFSFLAMIFSLGINPFPFFFTQELLHLAAHAHRGRACVHRDVCPADGL